MIWNANNKFYALIGMTTLGSFLLAGCAQPAATPSTSAPAVTTNSTAPALPTNKPTSAGPSSTASTGTFDDAANSMSRVEEAKVALDTAIDAKKPDQVREADTKIRDTVKTMPDQSSALPEDKRVALDTQVKNIGELADMTDKSGDAGDWKSVGEHQTAMHDALAMMKGMYPAGVMRGHMPDMNPSGKSTPDTGMPGKGMGNKMGGRGMGDNMGGMGGQMGDKMSGSGNHPGPNNMPTPGGAGGGMRGGR